MSELLNRLIPSMLPAELDVHENLAILPLSAELNGGPEYLTLQEALSSRTVQISEISAGGSVPNLTVVNTGEACVLILDGEELVGAKQNRVLNTTILIKEKSETIVPVSCTEHGRWSSRETGLRMGNAEFIHSPGMREMKARSVSASLKTDGSFRSNQGAVWNKVAEMAADANVRSNTGAMWDVVREKTPALNSYLEHFKCLPEQRGFVAMINGKVAGLDWISYQPAYEKLFTKLIKSYALDALLKFKKPDEAASRDRAMEFLQTKVSNAEEFKSVGHGMDVRINQPGLVGSALVFQDTVIHLALFPTSSEAQMGSIINYEARLRFRR